MPVYTLVPPPVSVEYPPGRILKTAADVTMLDFSGTQGGGIITNTKGVEVTPFIGDVTLNRVTNGAFQYSTMSSDTNFLAPSGGVDGAFLDIGLSVTGTPDLTFTGISMSPAAQDLLPITLEDSSKYLVRLAHTGGLWILIDIAGPW